MYFGQQQYKFLQTTNANGAFADGEEFDDYDQEDES